MAMLMRPVTAAEIAATAFDRWVAQYEHYRDEDKTADGVSKAERRHMFQTQTHTPENVAKIINPDWAYPQCSGCGKRWPVVSEFKDEWGDERWAICLPCAERITSLLRQFPDADKAVQS